MSFALSLASPLFSNYTSLLLGRGDFKGHHDLLIRPKKLVYSSLPAEKYTVCWLKTGRCVTTSFGQCYGHFFGQSLPVLKYNVTTIRV
jgi:hypothetical protein